MIACAFGAAEAAAEAHEDGAGDDVAHGEVGDGDVFEEGAVYGFEREALAAFEDAVGDGDVDESAVGFGAALDAAGAADLLVVGGAVEFFEGAVEDRSEVIAAGDEAVGDGDVLGGAVVAEGEG